VRDFYRILGIPDNATTADIKSAYRRLAKLYHPDLNPGSKHSEEKFKEILDAYTILSDDELRAQYDRKRKYGYSSPAGSYNAPPHNPNDPKRESQRKEYPPEYIEKMRQRNRTRIVKQIQRRKKILRGMIITFVLYLIATAIFESWISDQREKQSEQIVATLQDKHKRDSIISLDVIQNLDSPFDSVFGPAQTTWLSPNQLVVVNPFSDAVICLVHEPSGKTIRNEFIHAQTSFIMKEVPNGTFHVKVYTGDDWNTKKQVPDGRALGGFSTNERFFSIQREPITLIKPTYENKNTITTDTVRIDTSSAQIALISREDFFKN
jgi:curved DNA-binding protein CbpA